jgi:hypothetical protein
VISKLSSLVTSRRVRVGVALIALALILAPTLARARQRVERRDSTRLSIKHSWLGVKPPSKAMVAAAAPMQAAVAPRPVVQINRPRFVVRLDVSRSAPPCERCDDVVDPLRGPPSRLS